MFITSTDGSDLPGHTVTDKKSQFGSLVEKRAFGWDLPDNFNQF